MKLLTKEIKKRLPALYETEETDNPMIQVKFFNPIGRGTWYGIEYNPEEKLFYGYVDLGYPELGYFNLTELESVKLPLGLKIERDLHFKPTKLNKIREKHE